MSDVSITEDIRVKTRFKIVHYFKLQGIFRLKSKKKGWQNRVCG